MLKKPTTIIRDFKFNHSKNKSDDDLESWMNKETTRLSKQQ